MSGKNLDYFGDHPDELPDDPELLAQLAEGESITADVAEGETDDDKPVENETVINGEQVSDDKDPDGVYARDGKHIIPFSELEKSRNEAAKLREELDQQKAAIAELQNAQEKPKEEDPEPTELDKLNEEYGDTSIAAQAIDQALRTESLEERTQKAETALAALQAERKEQEAALYQQQVDAAINNNLTLSEWRKDPERWEDVLAMNEVVINKEKFQNASLDDIAAEIVRRLGGDSTAVQSATKALPNDTPQINSLSDIPGGTAPSQTDLESVNGMTGADLTQKLESMTQEQADAYIASLG